LIGRFIKVRITEALTNTLRGEVIHDIRSQPDHTTAAFA